MAQRSNSSPRIADPSTQVITKEIEFDKMLAFSGYPETNSVHTSREAAVALGLPNAVAQGLQTYAYLCEWLVEFFGEDWFRGGQLAVSFLSLVLPGDQILVKGELRESKQSEDGTRVSIDVWCENHRGEKVAAGVGSATVR